MEDDVIFTYEEGEYITSLLYTLKDIISAHTDEELETLDDFIKALENSSTITIEEQEEQEDSVQEKNIDLFSHLRDRTDR